MPNSTKQDVEQLECPYPGDPYVTNAQTQEGAAARLIEHMIDNHPGGWQDPVKTLLIDRIKGITGQFH